ncbi:hypothetical protein M3484_10280 [Pseudomonas sp. GX19020]|uniref:hypothetical protein n=1 Tax=Pseudomonas sp. GX19020 TaxID=2942277 RepID=UPI00201A21E9|nr:hypothetical protein [Pseudomonas sp. GX19020]MCL4066958.1 hypothetical protein [Pseudomonas sp. GX19020]
MKKFSGIAAVLTLAACIGPDGSSGLGADRSQQVFTFTMNGGGKGSSCSVTGAGGQVSSGTNYLGAPYVTIRGNVRQGVIFCQDAAGGRYSTMVNQQSPAGLRNVEASASVIGMRRDAYPVRMLVSGGAQSFYRAFVRLR